MNIYQQISFSLTSFQSVSHKLCWKCLYSLKFMLKFYQCDSVRRWGLWDVIRSKTEALWVELKCLAKRGQWGHSKESSTTKQEEALNRHYICSSCEFRLPTVQMMRTKFLLFKSQPVYRILWLQPKLTKIEDLNGIFLKYKSLSKRLTTVVAWSPSFLEYKTQSLPNLCTHFSPNFSYI